MSTISSEPHTTSQPRCTEDKCHVKPVVVVAELAEQHDAARGSTDAEIRHAAESDRYGMPVHPKHQSLFEKDGRLFGTYNVASQTIKLARGQHATVDTSKSETGDKMLGKTKHTLPDQKGFEPLFDQAGRLFGHYNRNDKTFKVSEAHSASPTPVAKPIGNHLPASDTSPRMMIRDLERHGLPPFANAQGFTQVAHASSTVAMVKRDMTPITRELNSKIGGNQQLSMALAVCSMLFMLMIAVCAFNRRHAAGRARSVMLIDQEDIEAIQESQK